MFDQPELGRTCSHELGLLRGMSLAAEMAANCSGRHRMVPNGCVNNLVQQFAGFTHVRPLAAWWRKHNVLAKAAQFRRGAAMPHTHRPLFDLALIIVRHLSEMVALDVRSCIFLLQRAG